MLCIIKTGEREKGYTEWQKKDFLSVFFAICLQVYEFLRAILLPQAI